MWDGSEVELERPYDGFKNIYSNYSNKNLVIET